MDRRGQSQVAQLRLGAGNFSIYEGVNTIGRNRDATVNIKNMNISQHHAIIVVHEGEHYISDLNSSNNCFCEGTRMQPYKLYKLRNRIEITLGGLSGIYVTNAAFFEGDKPSHSTTLASQSFYGSNTQPLENFVDDIHEGPTQEICWANIKSNINSHHRNNDESVSGETARVLKKSINQETDNNETELDRLSFFEEPTQVFDIRQSIRNKCQKSNSNESMDKIVNNMIDCEEASTSKSQTTTKTTREDDNREDCKEDNEQQKLENVEARDKENPAVCENAAAATDNLGNAKTTKEKSDDEMTDCEEDNQQNTTFTSGLTKDAELTDCEEHAISSNPEKVDKIKEKSAHDDDEMTDCEEDNQQATTSASGNKKLAEDDELTDCEEDAIPSNQEKIKEKSVQVDDEMTDCEEEAATSNQQKLDKVKSRDDEMTDCEEEAPTSNQQTLDKVVKSDDDEMTDCEEEAPISNQQKPDKVKSDDDEMTDCEENDKAQLKNKIRKTTSQTNKVTNEESLEVDSNDSNDSIGFFKFDNSNSNNESEFLGFENPSPRVASDEQNANIVRDNHKSAIVQDDQDTDDDSISTFASTKKKKSFMVLSTQDFDDSYLENQKTKSEINMDADDEIPATQYQMLNETDLAPGTRQINNEPRTASRSSSEEISGNKSIQDMFNSSNQNTEADEAPGTKTNLNEFSAAITLEIQPCGSKDTNNLDDLDFIGPTQKIETSFTRKNNIEPLGSNLDETDFFVGPTQKIETSFTRKNKAWESKNTTLDDTEFFAAPTQKLVASSSNLNKKHDLTADVDFYDAPTQKVTQEDDCFLLPTQKLTTNKQKLFTAEDTQEIYQATTQKIFEDDSFLAPTQKLTQNISKQELHVFEDSREIYDVPTQKVRQDNIFSSPTQNLTLNILKKEKLNFSEGIYDAPNQNEASTEDEGIVDDVFIEPTPKKQNSTECYNDKSNVSIDIFDVSTQMVPMEQEKVDGYDTFSAPTQKLNVSDAGINDTLKKPYMKDKIEVTALVETLRKQHNDESIESTSKSPQKVEKKKTFSFKKSHLDATISDLAETKTSKRADKVEEPKIEKLTIKKTKKPDAKIGNDEIGRLSKKEAKEAGKISKTKKRAVKQAMEPDNFEEIKIEKRSRRKAEKSNNVEYNKIEKLTIKKTKEPANNEEAKIEKPTIKNVEIIDNVDNDKIEELAEMREGKSDNSRFNKTDKLVIKRTKEPANIEESKIEKLAIKKDKKINNVENNKTEKLTIKSAKASANIEETKIEKLTIKGRTIDNVEDNKIEKLTIKKSITTKILNSDEHLIPKFLTENSSSIINKESTSFNASNSEQNKSLALLESKFNKTKKSVNASEEIKIMVPKNRRSKSIATVEELQSETTKRASKRTAKKTQEAPAKKVAKNDDEGKVSSVSGRKIRATRKIAEVESDSEQSKVLTLASASNNLASVSEENSANRKGKATRGKSRAVEEANNNNDENSRKARAGTSRSTKSKKRQTTTDDDASGEGSPLKKQKLQLIPESPGSPLKGLRKQRPKVVFTMMESPKLESLIKQLGGSIVDSVETCTVLITEHVKRTQKLLTAIGLGKPICSPNWITDSKKMQEFLDPWDYILTDPEAEQKWSFSLRESLTLSRDLQLLRSYSFFIQVINGVDVLKGAIESCGGKVLPKIPSTPSEGTYIISSPENRSKYSRILKKNPDFKVIEAEAVFDGVLRQELRFDRHLLK